MTLHGNILFIKLSFHLYFKWQKWASIKNYNTSIQKYFKCIQSYL